MAVKVLSEHDGGIAAVLVDHMGSDLSVSNAARVTMGISHQELDEKDSRLIKFLAREHHQTPFRHATVTMRCKAPIFLARQLVKHQVGFSWNEMSRRYKDGDVELFIPDVLHSRPDSLHSGSGVPFPVDVANDLLDIMKHDAEHSVATYEYLLGQGVAPEQARMVLPQNMITEWVWTGSLLGWFQMYAQRSTEHAQYEAQVFASQVHQIMSELYPESWGALCEHQITKAV